jgi:hypothetical protein
MGLICQESWSITQRDQLLATYAHVSGRPDVRDCFRSSWPGSDLG